MTDSRCDSAANSMDLSPERFGAVLSSISDGVFTVDAEGRITCFNRAAEQITGYRREEAIGRPCHEILQTNICKDACALRYTLETGRPVVDLVVHITTAGGVKVPVSISTALFRNQDGEVEGGAETFRDLRQVEALRRQVQERYRFGDIISRSASMQRILDTLPTIAGSESTVLITGESGTGKELLAHAIHDLSERSRGPFVAVNAAGIPDTLLEAELFGYERGAFTGAVRAKPGRFTRAEKGTLFLDEIGDLPLPLQVKLLRVLQERTYEPLGGVKTLRADARILTATNHDLAAMVADGRFRQDLYYRVKVFEIRLPPLRERMEDVPLLVEHFVRDLAVARDKHVVGVSPEALEVLMAHRYPGNVRELRNAVEHGFVLCQGRLIEPRHLPRWLTGANPRLPERGARVSGTLEDMERHYILAALRQNDFNRLATARQLGIHKSTLYRKIRRLDLQLPDIDGRSKTRR
jgi:PAS domain S-box-containing protein